MRSISKFECVLGYYYSFTQRCSNCSTFKQFHQLYRDYQLSASDPVQEIVDHNGQINVEVSLPIDVICEKLPALQVSGLSIGSSVYRSLDSQFDQIVCCVLSPMTTI